MPPTVPRHWPRVTDCATFAPGNRARVNDLHIGARLLVFRFLGRQRNSPTYYGYFLLVCILRMLTETDNKGEIREQQCGIRWPGQTLLFIVRTRR